MRFRWAKLLVAFWATTSTAQGSAQEVREIGIQGVAAASDPASVVAGLYGAVRASARTRLSGFIGGGTSDGDFVWRAEVLAYFLLSPDRHHGWGPYIAGGVAAVGGPAERGYIVL